eukprot:549570-Lingulodinium_polyedra.AAC.1
MWQRPTNFALRKPATRDAGSSFPTNGASKIHRRPPGRALLTASVAKSAALSIPSSVYEPLD